MKIGIVGPEISVKIIQKIIQKIFPHIITRIYIKEKVADAHELFPKCEIENDVVLFSGIGVMKSVLNSKVILKQPYDYVPKREYSILQALWEMNNEKKFPKKISLDVVSKFSLDEATEEFNLSFDESYVLPYHITLTEKKYQKFHEDLYNEGKIDAIITGFFSLYTNFKKKKYPVYWLKPTSMQIRERVEKLIAKRDANLLNGAGIAIQIIKLSQSETSLCQYEIIKRKGHFELELLKYIKEIQGTFFNFGRDEYIIFSTRGAIECKENILYYMNLMEEQKKHGFNFYSGIGFGMTAYTGEVSARKALANSVDLKKSSLFIVDGKNIKGPIGENDELTYSIKVSDDKTLKISRATGINVTYITKIISLSKKISKKEFDSKELGDYLGISERSARRILKKLLDGGFATISGKELVKGIGRPKNIVSLNF